MRYHRLTMVMIFAACLSSSVSFLRAKAPPEPIAGRWELVGFGDIDGNLAQPVRLLIAIDVSGRFEYQLWENGEEGAFKVSGDWTVTDNVLTLVPRGGEALKAAEQVYRITWDGGTLVLHAVEDGARNALPLRFANRLGGTP